MDESTIKERLKRLKRIDKGNRERSKRYLDKIKASGKKQISAILSSKAYEELNRRRDESMRAGKPLSYGAIISSALISDVNDDVNTSINNATKNISKSNIKNNDNLEPGRW